MIALVDYGAGNMASVANALRFLDLSFVATDDARMLQEADAILLPGVGAFRAAMQRLAAKNLVEVLQEEAPKKPFLGICLGLQLLFEVGEEFGETRGLGLIPGRVRLIRSQGMKLPAIGWNTLHIKNPCALTEGICEGSWAYYVHSFCADTDLTYVTLTSDYGEVFPGMVHAAPTIFGCQFHPEKSGQTGLNILKNFGRLAHDYSTSH